MACRSLGSSNLAASSRLDWANCRYSATVFIATWHPHPSRLAVRNSQLSKDIVPNCATENSVTAAGTRGMSIQFDPRDKDRGAQPLAATRLANASAAMYAAMLCDLPLPSGTLPDSSNPVSRPWPTRCPLGRSGCTKSSIRLPVHLPMEGNRIRVFSRRGTATLIGCHGSWTPFLGFPHLP
jgi:hypothetical protein